MSNANRVLPNLEALNPTELKALIVSQHELIVSRDSEIEQLKLLIAKLRRMQFGRSSEKLDRQIEQLELRLEALQQSDAEMFAAMPGKIASVEPGARSVRRPLPAHLPREVRTHLPKQKTCPDCGGELRKLGEDVSEVLERIPSRFQVIRHVRVKLACACCERIVQAAAPSRPIARGIAGPGLLAHVLVSKYAITCRFIGNKRFTSAKAWSWSARHWPTGWEKRAAASPAGGSAAAIRDGRREAARGRYARSGVGPWFGKDKNRTTVDVCTRRSASGRPDTTRGVVRLFTGSQRRTSQSSLEPIQRNAAGGWLRGLRSDL